MKPYQTVTGLLAALILLVGSATQLCAQTHADEILQRTIRKVKAINDDHRVLEKSYSDNIYASDSVLTNCYYKHNLYVGNTYRLNAFASSEDASDLNVYVMHEDENGKMKLDAYDNITGTDVSFTFRPTVRAQYYLVVKAKLRTNVKNCFFTLLVDRE